MISNSFSIEHNHYFFSSSEDIVEISQPLLIYGITYFSFTRTYKNGGRIYLTTHPQILENYINNKWYLIGNSEGRSNQYKSEIVFWSTLPNQEVFDNNTRAYGLDHGIFIIDQRKDYCDFYGFAAQKQNYLINSTYLNIIEQLKKYILYFNEKAANIIHQAELSRIILPFNENKLIINDTHSDGYFEKLISNYQTKYHKLSRRQIECAKLLIQGKTLKEIAKHTKLSHRTIEYYTQIMRKKLNCRNKSEMIIKLMDYLL